MKKKKKKVEWLHVCFPLIYSHPPHQHKLKDKRSIPLCDLFWLQARCLVKGFFFYRSITRWYLRFQIHSLPPKCTYHNTTTPAHNEASGKNHSSRMLIASWNKKNDSGTKPDTIKMCLYCFFEWMNDRNTVRSYWKNRLIWASGCVAQWPSCTTKTTSNEKTLTIE